MSPSYQHIFVECPTISIHALYKFKVSGLNVDQLKQLTARFHLEKTSPEYKDGCEYTAKVDKPSMMSVLNYLSEALGFVVFAVTLGEADNQFFLRKEILNL